MTRYLKLLCEKHITGVHEGRTPFKCEHATFGSNKKQLTYKRNHLNASFVRTTYLQRFARNSTSITKENTLFECTMYIHNFFDLLK